MFPGFVNLFLGSFLLLNIWQQKEWLCSVIELIDFLDGLINECRDVKDMRCIVFMERKIARKVLAYFLSSIAMFASSL